MRGTIARAIHLPVIGLRFSARFPRAGKRSDLNTAIYHGGALSGNRKKQPGVRIQRVPVHMRAKVKPGRGSRKCTIGEHGGGCAAKSAIWPSSIGGTFESYRTDKRGMSFGKYGSSSKSSP